MRATSSEGTDGGTDNSEDNYHPVSALLAYDKTQDPRIIIIIIIIIIVIMMMMMMMMIMTVHDRKMILYTVIAGNFGGGKFKELLKFVAMSH